MSGTTRPSMEEIRSILADMARCVASDEDPTLDPVIRAGIRRAVDELERFIPGLDPVPTNTMLLGYLYRPYTAHVGFVRLTYAW